MFSQRQASRGLAIGGIVALAVLPTGSNASDSKVHSAAFCRVAPTMDAPSTAVEYIDTEIRNRGAERMSVICPIVRDTVANEDGWDKIVVGMFDRSPGDDIECRAFSRRNDGFVMFEEPFKSESSLAFGWKPVPGPNANLSVENGYYHLNCTIPALITCQGPCACDFDVCISGLAYYRIQEP